MPLPVPNLDDRTFDQLAAEARALIPQYFPDWTDHNPSDPGITLLEAFAHLFEAALYQLNRVPDRTLENFALLAGAPPKEPEETIEALLRTAITGLKASKHRALTPDELEQAVIVSPSLNVKRAKVVVETRNRPNVSPAETVVTLVIVPSNADLTPEAGQKMREEVFTHLRPRCLVTTRLRISLVEATEISLSIVVVRSARFPVARESLKAQIEACVKTFLNDGKDGKGWEFGRSVFRSELYQIIEAVPGVEYIRELCLKGSSRFGVGDLADPIRLAEQLKGTDPVSAYLWGQLLPEQQEALRLANATRPVAADLQKALVEALNQLLNTSNLYNSMVFTKPKFQDTNKPEPEELKKYTDGLLGYNRRLLEDAFPKELTRIPDDVDASRGELPLPSSFSVVALKRGGLDVKVVDV